VVGLVGFDRMPPAVATPHAAAGSAVRNAATALTALTRGDVPSCTVADATEGARTHATHVLEQASHATGWGLDRGDIVAGAFALRGISDRIDDVAEGLDRAPFRAVWIAPCGVVRDLTRAVDRVGRSCG
jgi:hypothetical protein